MAHFAKLDSNNVVTQVIVVANEDTSDVNGVEDEAIGIAFLQGLFGENTIWKQTSYNSNIRGRYAGPGFTYDSVDDVFVPPAPYSNWILNSSTHEWEAPITMPPLTSDMETNGQTWVWDEASGNWTESDPAVSPPSE